VERYSNWPTTIPPFALNYNFPPLDPVMAMPDGRLLIERVWTAARPANTYDIIDRRGIRAATISMPRSQRIIAFGVRSVYTIETDANDLLRVQRHPWR
jgi:hypothetical protein